MTTSHKSPTMTLTTTPEPSIAQKIQNTHHVDYQRGDAIILTTGNSDGIVSKPGIVVGFINEDQPGVQISLDENPGNIIDIFAIEKIAHKPGTCHTCRCSTSAERKDNA